MSEAALAKRSFLVVEDESFTRTIVLTILRDLGASESFAAANGAEATIMLSEKAKDIDAVVCDFNMPKMNGIELLQAIRSGRTGARRELPFAMLTGSSDRALVGAAIALDVNAFLVKPVAKRALAERLGRILKERRQLKSAAAYAFVDADFAPTEKPVPAKTPQADAVEEHKSIEGLPLNAVLARDIVINGCKIMPAGAVIGETELQRLRGFADLSELLGTLPPIHVLRAVRASAS
ncbi:MAG: response regulator [Alphaproteobacteria bacterium]|nr:response regulator [Alphaproteobacteria bacterium]